MAIIGALPVTLTNGTTADATQVMADFNSIVSQVNANGAGLAGGNSFTGSQTIGGDTIVTLSASQTLTGKTMQGPNGTVGSPTYSFSGSSSTGMWEPATNTLGLATNGINVVYIDAAQNIGVGVTPSAWSVNNRVIELPNGCGINAFTGGVASMSIQSNEFFNGTNSIRKIADAVGQFTIQSGSHIWFIAPTGAAGSSFSFTQAMTLDNLGRLSGTAFHNNVGGVAGTANQYIASGTYTPTFTLAGNIASATSVGFQWIRVGNVVHVTGNATVTPSLAAGCILRLTLPIPSATVNLSGCVQSNNIANGYGINSFSGLASAFATANSASASPWLFTFSYEVS